MKPTISSITEEILDGDVADMSAEVILIHKTRFKGFDKMFRIVSVDTDSGMKRALIENAREALEGVKKNIGSITAFSNPADANSYVTMDLGMLPRLDALLAELRAHSGYHGSHRFDELKEKGIGCLILKSGAQRAFVFFNVGKNHLRPDKYIVSSLTNDGLSLHRGELIVFEKYVFAVYYEDLENLLITSYASAKKLLGLNEQFKSKCIDILDDKLKILVSLENTDYKTLLGNMATNEKMVKMDSRGAFKAVNRKTLEDWNQFHAKTPLEGTDSIKLNPVGKAVIADRNNLEMLLCVLNNEIVEPVTDRRSYALAPSKKTLEVSRQKAGPSAPPRRDQSGARRNAEPGRAGFDASPRHTQEAGDA